MNYKLSTTVVWVTNDYSIFKYMDVNRKISNVNVAKLVESINEVGWLKNPLLVNEKFEVIDGQHRLEALKKLGLPVEFIIQDSLGRKECTKLNESQKNWAIMDYVNSYANEGNDNYIWLRQQIKTYNILPNTTVLSVAVGGKNMNGGRIYADTVKSGKFSIDDDTRVNVEALLFYLSRFSDTVKVIKGRADTFYSAINFLYNLDGIDNERLVRTINNARYEMVSSGTIEGCLSQIEHFYNKGLSRANKKDIIHEFKIA